MTILHHLTTIILNLPHLVLLLVSKDGDQASGVGHWEALLQDTWPEIEDNRGIKGLEHISLERFGTRMTMERAVRGMVDWGEPDRLGLQGRLSLLQGIQAQGLDRRVGGEPGSI